MFVLDTNILSAIMSTRPSPEVAAWIAGQREDALFTTTICQAEILAGLAAIFTARRRAGRPTAPLDLMIAAVARANAAGVVTRDIGSFEDCGVHLSIRGRLCLEEAAAGRPRRQENVRGCRAWAQGCRYFQSVRRLRPMAQFFLEGFQWHRRQAR